MRATQWIAALALVGLMSAVPSPCQQDENETSLGAATLTLFDRVTIVYPAGSDDEETNRRSAELRASWLAGRFGMEVRVLADREATPEDLLADLLLLGWDNSLLGTEQVPMPFVRTEEKLEIVGVAAFDPDCDLLLFHPSPYDPAYTLTFWSRIDPELDRYMVFPILGSDWGVYDRFLPLAQGMFLIPGHWPPQRNRRAEKDHRPDLAPLFDERSVAESEHFRMSYDPADLTEDEVRRALTLREQALAAAAASLGTTADGIHIDLHVYADSEVKARLSGVPDPVHSIPRQGEMHMIKRYVLSRSIHEEVHHVARKTFGPCYLSAMYEGLALDVDAAKQDENLDLRIAMMLDADTLPELEDLIVEGRMTALPTEAVYPATPVLVRWLRQTYGDERFGRAYGLEEGGLDALAGALDVRPRKLQHSWQRWTRKRAATQDDELAYVKLMAQAREDRLVGDHAAIARGMRAALKLKPDDPAALLQLGVAETRLGEFDEARARFEQLLEQGLGPNSGYTIRTHFELGRLLDVQGQREAALEQYRRVLELPNRGDLHLRATEAIEVPVTADALD